MTTPNIHIVPVLEDNYAYVIESGSSAVVVDPGEASPIVALLDTLNAAVSHILITHYDHDHIGGVDCLQRRNQAHLIGPQPSPMTLNHIALPGEVMNVNGITVQVIDTPGHAFPHVAYYLPDPGWLFSGDCLFGGGCGRLAGNTAPVMWASLQALNRLPEKTEVYFGHEYTRSNLAFAQSVEPDNPHIRERLMRVQRAMQQGGFSSPSTLSEERSTNPFLRTDSVSIRSRMGLSAASDLDVFAALRKAKNSFRG